MSLSPLIASALFVAAILAGYQYRKVWKSEGPAWKAWVFGVLAGGLFLAVALIPLSASGS